MSSSIELGSMIGLEGGKRERGVLIDAHHTHSPVW